MKFALNIETISAMVNAGNAQDAEDAIDEALNEHYNITGESLFLYPNAPCGVGPWTIEKEMPEDEQDQLLATLSDLIEVAKWLKNFMDKV